jgi:hypothetical protein
MAKDKRRTGRPCPRCRQNWAEEFGLCPDCEQDALDDMRDDATDGWVWDDVRHLVSGSFR